MGRGTRGADLEAECRAALSRVRGRATRASLRHRHRRSGRADGTKKSRLVVPQDQDEWLRELVTRLANVADGAGPGHWQQWQHWLQWADELLEAGIPRSDYVLRARVLNAWGLFHRHHGRLRDAVRVLKAALALYKDELQDFGGSTLFVNVALNLCGTYAALGMHKVAHHYCATAIHALLLRAESYPASGSAPARVVQQSAMQLAMAQYNMGTILEHLRADALASQSYAFAASVATKAGDDALAGLAAQAERELQHSRRLEARPPAGVFVCLPPSRPTD